MKWIEVQVKTTCEFEDIISDILYSAGATGLAIEDPRDIMDLEQSEISWDFMDPRLIDLEINQVIIKAYFAEDDKGKNIVEDINSRIKKHPMLKQEENIVTIDSVSDDDWAESWKKFYKPTKIGKNLLIKPTWEEAETDEATLLIELDPGMAFGTGTHETTVMCAEALEKYLKEDDLVFDIGAGSGILSIIAAKLGAKKVIAIDLDPVSTQVSNENVQLNRVDDIVEVRSGNLLDKVEEKADLIVSNIIAEVIADMVMDLKDHLKDEGIFISSGIIIKKIPLVKDALIENGYTILDIVEKDEWACIISSK